MPLSEREKRDRGDWYNCRGPELLAAQEAARRACHAHGTLPPDARGAMAPELRALFASVGEDVWLEAPFHCAYGHNITFGDRVYLNTGCVILDTGPVTIGAGTMMGPGVQVYCADHHHDRALRTKGLERALPVSIGADVWIGGSAILLPGIRIGDGAIIGAGSVVTRDIPPGARAVGNPARILPDQA